MDTLKGTVTRVIDGDSFIVRIDWKGLRNRFAYKDNERVRLYGRNAPDLGAPGGYDAYETLRDLIETRRIHLDVISRDTYGRLVASFSLLPDWRIPAVAGATRRN